MSAYKPVMRTAFRADGPNARWPPVTKRMMAGAWIAVELKHLPEALELIKTARGYLASLPFSDESARMARQRLQEFDGVLACQLINLNDDDLEELLEMPDVLEGLQLFFSRAALLYALGHEDLLRADGSIPAEESSSGVAQLFQKLADQPAAAATWRPAVLNGTRRQSFATSVLGARVAVLHEATDASISVAEAIAGAIEAFFATAFEIDAAAHMERFDVQIVEADVAKFVVSIDDDRVAVTVTWPRGVVPQPGAEYDDYLEMLMEVATTVFSCICHVRDPKKALPRLFEADAALDRIAMVAAVCLSRARIFGGVSRLHAWKKHSPKRYEMLTARTRIERSTASVPHDDSTENDVSEEVVRSSAQVHRDMRVRSVIDVHLWDRAGWIGAAYGHSVGDSLPWFGLMFTDGHAGTRIFERWRERFGEVDVDEEIFIGIIRRLITDSPTHYGIFLTSAPRSEVGMETSPARTHLLHPSDDVNLSRFLANYSISGGYLLMPAIVRGSGPPTFVPDLSLTKRSLSVKDAGDIADGTLEAAHLKLFRGEGRR